MRPPPNPGHGHAYRSSMPVPSSFEAADVAELPPGAADALAQVNGALQRVELTFDEALRSDLPPVQHLVRHIEAYRGKMLRPQLVLACGLAASGHSKPGTLPIRPDHIVIGAVCEMIHMATLVHDDVLDEADVRRRGATVNRLRGNEAAVILGDYLFSSAYRLCSTLPGAEGQRAALLIGQTGMTLCSGELLQLHHRGNFSLDEPTYLRIVEKKTASLIGAACRLGALASGVDAPTGDCFNAFGVSLGIAFQIQDDLLDLTGNQSVVGKPLNRDAELGKLTLPVIHHLAHADPDRRGRTLLLLKQVSEQETDHAEHLLNALASTGSVDYARDRAVRLVEEARSSLVDLPETPGKQLLMHMAQRVVARSF